MNYLLLGFLVSLAVVSLVLAKYLRAWTVMFLAASILFLVGGLGLALTGFDYPVAASDYVKNTSYSPCSEVRSAFLCLDPGMTLVSNGSGVFCVNATDVNLAWSSGLTSVNSSCVASESFVYANGTGGSSTPGIVRTLDVTTIGIGTLLIVIGLACMLFAMHFQSLEGKGFG